MIKHTVLILNDSNPIPIYLRVGLEYNHLMVHEGKFHGFYVEAINMADQADLFFLVRVGDVPLHIGLDLEAIGGLLRGRIYKGPTLTSPGSAYAWGKFNEYHDSPMSTSLFTSPVISGAAYGDLKVNRLVLASGQGNSRVNSAVRAAVERVWEPHTDYLIRMTALAANVTVTLTGAAYEEEI